MNRASSEETSYWSHRVLLSSVRQARESTQESRDMSDQGRDYFDGKQWTEEELTELRRRKQPVQTRNRIRKKVNLLAGLEQSRRNDPKAYPRSEDTAMMAEVATRVIRSNCDRMRFDRIRSRVFKDLLIEGTGAAYHTVREMGGELVTHAERIRLQDLIYDPQSIEEDFSDAGFMGRGRYIPVDDLRAMFPNALNLEADLRDADSSQLSDPHDGVNDTGIVWYEAKSRRAYVVQMFYRHKGKWCFATLTGTQVLEEGESPHRDEYGKTVCPIIAQSCYVGRDLIRYGIVRDMISPQDGLNKRSSKMLALLSANQTFAGPNGVANVNKFRAEKAKLDGHLEGIGEWGKDFGVIDRGQEIAGHAQLYQLELAEMESQGANPGLAGRTGSELSGRAIQAQQQAGLREENDSFDALADWTLRFYGRDLDASRQFYTDERKIRVGGNEDAPKFLTLNQGASDPFNPTRNPMAQLAVDMVLDTGPDTVTIRQEQFEQVLELAKLAPQMFPMPVLLELGDFTTETRRKIEEAMSGGDDPQAQQQRAEQAQLQQQAQQLELQGRQADVADKMASAQERQARTAKIAAETQETQAELSGQHPDQFMEVAKMRADMNQRAAAVQRAQ